MRIKPRVKQLFKLLLTCVLILSIILEYISLSVNWKWSVLIILTFEFSVLISLFLINSKISIMLIKIWCLITIFIGGLGAFSQIARFLLNYSNISLVSIDMLSSVFNIFLGLFFWLNIKRFTE